MSKTEFKLDPQMKIGPVSLRVKNPSLMLEFYEKELGFKVLRSDGNTYALGARDETSPSIILKNDAKAEAAPRDAAGLYHFAILVPDRRSLADVYVSAGNAGIIFDGFADHLVSEALYLADPEGNGIEIYADRPRGDWKFEDGQVKMATEPLDIDSLLKERLGGLTDGPPSMPPGTRIGHVHLKVTNLERSIAFYQGTLGLNLMIVMVTLYFMQGFVVFNYLCRKWSVPNTWTGAYFSATAFTRCCEAITEKFLP